MRTFAVVCAVEGKVGEGVEFVDGRVVCRLDGATVFFEHLAGLTDWVAAMPVRRLVFTDHELQADLDAARARSGEAVQHLRRVQAEMVARGIDSDALFMAGAWLDALTEGATT